VAPVSSGSTNVNANTKRPTARFNNASSGSVERVGATAGAARTTREGANAAGPRLGARRFTSGVPIAGASPLQAALTSQQPRPQRPFHVPIGGATVVATAAGPLLLLLVAALLLVVAWRRSLSRSFSVRIPRTRLQLASARPG
jgi:hypothetical protein